MNKKYSRTSPAITHRAQQENQAAVIEQQVVDRCGLIVWDNHLRYAYGDCKISPDQRWDAEFEGVPHVNLDPSQTSFSEALTDYLAQLLVLCPGVSDILFFIILLGFMKTIMNKAGFPVAFTTNVYGSSGSGKTRMVKLFCRCYQKPDGTLAYMSSFYERKNDLRHKLEVEGLHDVNYLVDDYHPATGYEKKRQEDLLDYIVRLPESIPEGANIIITSEFTDGVFSNQDRQLQLYIGSNSHMTLLSELEWNSDKLTQIYYIFLFAVMKNYPEVLLDIRDWKRQYCNRAFPHRCELYAQQLYLVEHLFYKYCFSGEPFYSIKDSLETVLTRQKKGLDRVRHRENESDPLVELKLMLENEDIISYAYTKDEFEESNGKLVYKVLSKKHDFLLYITRHTLEVGMRKQTGDTSFYYGDLIDILAERKMLLLPKSGKERTRKLKCIRCYVIKHKDLYEYIEGYKETHQYLSE